MNFIIEKVEDGYDVTRNGCTTGCQTKGDAIGIIIDELEE